MPANFGIRFQAIQFPLLEHIMRLVWVLGACAGALRPGAPLRRARVVVRARPSECPPEVWERVPRRTASHFDEGLYEGCVCGLG